MCPIALTNTLKRYISSPLVNGVKLRGIECYSHVQGVKGTSCHVPTVAWEAQRTSNIYRRLGDTIGHVPKVMKEVRRISDVCNIMNHLSED